VPIPEGFENTPTKVVKPELEEQSLNQSYDEHKDHE
jgi:hypothetical protein